MSLEIGGIKILCGALIDPSLESISEDILMTLTGLLNDPETRDRMMEQFSLKKIFSFFSDIERFEPKDSKSEPFHTVETRFRMASRVIISLFKSWSGLFYLGWEKTGLVSLIEALRQPIKPTTRAHIFELLEEIINISVNLSPKESDRGNGSMRR